MKTAPKYDFLGKYPDDYWADPVDNGWRVENKNTGNVEIAPTIARAVALDHAHETDRYLSFDWFWNSDGPEGARNWAE